MKFKLLVNIRIAKIDEILRFKSKSIIYPAMLINVKMPIIVDIYEQDKFLAQLS